MNANKCSIFRMHIWWLGLDDWRDLWPTASLYRDHTEWTVGSCWCTVKVLYQLNIKHSTVYRLGLGMKNLDSEWAFYKNLAWACSIWTSYIWKLLQVHKVSKQVGSYYSWTWNRTELEYGYLDQIISKEVTRFPPVPEPTLYTHTIPLPKPELVPYFVNYFIL